MKFKIGTKQPKKGSNTIINIEETSIPTILTAILSIFHGIQDNMGIEHTILSDKNTT
jgi:hypothetical protein